MDPVTENLTRERDGLVGRANALLQTVAESNGGQGRDLNTDEREVLTRYRSRIGDIDSQLALTASDFSLNAETAAMIARYSPTAATQERAASPWRTPGEALWDYLHRGQDRDAADRIIRFEREANRRAQQDGGDGAVQIRAAQHMGQIAAETVAVAGGFGGMIVSPVAGPIIDLGWSGTPLLDALGAQPAPNGYSFLRPRIIDPDLDTAAGPQAGGKQKGELPSKKFDVDAETVKISTVGNYINISQQVLSWLPGGLEIVMNQLRRRTERAAEKAAVAELNKATITVPLADTADSAAVLAAFGAAAAKVFAATGAMPTWLASGPIGWERLFGLTDGDGRQMFPSTLTSFSVSVGGIGLTVTPGITSDDYYMGNGDSIELYRANLPVLSAVEPSVLGQQVAIAMGLGSYQPITVESPDGGVTPAVRGAVVKIGD